MMKLVVPLRVYAISAGRERADYADVVKVAFGDEPGLASQPLCLLVKAVGELSQDMNGAGIEDAVNRIQPQGVDVIFSEPIERIFDEEAPHAIAARTVEVDGLAPGSSVAGSEIGTKLGEIIPFRSEVVINDIQHDCETC